jgi:hypothetical protein
VPLPRKSDQAGMCQSAYDTVQRRSERERIAEERPLSAGREEGDHRHEHGRSRLRPTREALVEKGQTGRHEEHDPGAKEESHRIPRVDARNHAHGPKHDKYPRRISRPCRGNSLK